LTGKITVSATVSIKGNSFVDGKHVICIPVAIVVKLSLCHWICNKCKTE
jgi:hypothetical protein